MSKNKKKKIISCKVLILGEFNVGKSSIATRFLSNNFDYNKYSMSGAYQDTKSLYIKFRNLEYTRPKTI